MRSKPEEVSAGFFRIGDDHFGREPLADRPRVDHQRLPEFVYAAGFVHVSAEVDCGLFLLDILPDAFAPDMDACQDAVKFCFEWWGMGHKQPFFALTKGESR